MGEWHIRNMIISTQMIRGTSALLRGSAYSPRPSFFFAWYNSRYFLQQAKVSSWENAIPRGGSTTRKHFPMTAVFIPAKEALLSRDGSFQKKKMHFFLDSTSPDHPWEKNACLAEKKTKEVTQNAKIPGTASTCRASHFNVSDSD